MKFVARFKEGDNPPGHAFFFSHEIEAPSLEKAEAKARRLAAKWGDELWRVEPIVTPE